MPTYLIETLGCKANQHDSVVLARQLAAAGLKQAANGGEADLIVVNSCAVTQEAERQSLQIVRRLKRDHPAAKVVFTGCSATLHTRQLRSQRFADLILPNMLKSRGIQPLLELINHEVHCNTFADPLTLKTHLPGDRTRSFVKIQDGCDAECSFCVIWKLRGPMRGIPPDEVLSEANAAVANGAREIVLTGIRTGAYSYAEPSGRRSEGETDLARLLRMLDAVEGLQRVRISSIEPIDFSAQLLETVCQMEKVCPHFHIPLQSGSNKVLREMKRRYTREEYVKLVRYLRRNKPGVEFTADVLVGFPTETDDDFAQTKELCTEVEFLKLHVFPFSPRPKTPAWDTPDGVGDKIRRERAEELRETSDCLSRLRRKKMIGKLLDPIVETWNPRLRTASGTAGNYAKVVFACEKDCRGEAKSVRILGLKGDGVTGIPDSA
jgi:threonylcarbamoyladenosine tRNA methylthiotransferase MtaB